MARWSDIAEWVGPTVNQSDAMVEQRGLVVHIAEGYYAGTISYQKNPDANVSSHFILAGAVDVPHGTADGHLGQMVDTDVTAWTQRAGNGHWLSVECAGFTPNPLTAAQCETIAQLYAHGVTELGWPLTLAGNPDGRGLGYHSMGTPSNGWTGPTWGHEDCPGPNIIHQLPGILARAEAILGEGTDVAAATIMVAWDANNDVWVGDGTAGSRRKLGKRVGPTASGIAATDWSGEVKEFAYWRYRVQGDRSPITTAQGGQPGQIGPEGMAIVGPLGAASLDNLLGTVPAAAAAPGLSAHTHAVAISATGPISGTASVSGSSTSGPAVPTP